MGSFGMYLMIFGAGSAVLALFEYEFTLLSWVDNWGEPLAWFIRAGLIAVGGLLFNAEKRRVAAAQDEQAHQRLVS